MEKTPAFLIRILAKIPTKPPRETGKWGDRHQRSTPGEGAQHRDLGAAPMEVEEGQHPCWAARKEEEEGRGGGWEGEWWEWGGL